MAVAYDEARTVPRAARARLIFTFIGWLVGSYAAAMLAWVVIPALVLGWTPLVVVSGSMTPVIAPGDVVLVESSNEVFGPGTVIAFEDGQGITLHRIRRVEEGPVYTTQGDANPRPDSHKLTPDEVVGRGRLLVPYIGLAKVAGPAWWAGLAVLTAVSIPLWKHRSALSVAAVIALLAVAGVAAAVAAFVDDTAAEGSHIEALTVAPPTNFNASCTLLGFRDIDLSWSPSPTPGISGYRLYHQPPGGTLSPIGFVGPGTLSTTYQLPSPPIGLLQTHTFRVVAEHGPWQSSPSNTDSITILLTLLGVGTCA